MTMPVGLRSSCARLAHIALALLASCTHGTAGVIETTALRAGAPIVLDTTQRIVRWDPDLVPLTIRARPQGFAVLDRVAQQLVLLDTTLVPTRRVGRRGSGPGELDGILRLESWPGGLAVGEGANGRISLFTATGEFQGNSRRRYLGTPFALNESRQLMTPVQVLPYLVDVGSLDDAAPERTGRRPPVAHQDDARHMGRDLIVRRPDGRAIFIENRTGLLVQLRDDGTVTAQWTLPPALAEALRTQRRTRVAAFEARTGTTVFAAPLLKDASASGAFILLAHSVSPDCLVLLDLETAAAHPIRIGDEATSAAVCRAESVALTTQHLAVAADDSLLLFRSPILRLQY